MEFSDYWHAIVRGWWLIAIFGLVGLVVPLLLASPPKGHIETYYRSTSVVGSPPTSKDSSSLIGGGITTDQVLYYASTDAVMEETSSLSGLNESLPVVRSQISLVVPGGTGNSGGGAGQSSVVDVSAVGATPALALDLDTSFITAMNDYTNAVAKNNLLSSEQQTEQTLATVMTDIATNNFLPGLTAQALEVQVTALQNSLASLVIQQPGSGFQVVQAPAAAVHGRSRHWHPHGGRQPYVARRSGAADRTGRRCLGCHSAVDVGPAIEDSQAGPGGLGLSSSR